jgi:lipid A 3-O-deacylase
MRMRFFSIPLFCLVISSQTLFSKALDNTGMVPLLSFGGGIFNVQREKRTAQFQLEYKFAKAFLMARPQIGAFMTSKAAFYLYAGIGWDLHFSKYIVITPSFSPGVYFQGNDKNLGYPIEFRTCLEAAYKFKNKGRLGAQFYHLSNASLSSRNPGEESLIFFYSMPLD